jgi:hypothetical protein
MHSSEFCGKSHMTISMQSPGMQSRQLCWHISVLQHTTSSHLCAEVALHMAVPEAAGVAFEPDSSKGVRSCELHAQHATRSQRWMLTSS